MPSYNFEFLKPHKPIFLQLSELAERVFAHDPNTTLVKLRQLGEVFAQDIASRRQDPNDEPSEKLPQQIRAQREAEDSKTSKKSAERKTIKRKKATKKRQQPDLLMGAEKFARYKT